MTSRVGHSAARGLVRCITTSAVLATLAMLASLSPREAHAQQPKSQQPKSQQPRPQTQRRPPTTIEIRGQVPTPQVVTVRPRETPAYSRRVLVPGFFDHDFWPSILPPLDIVSAKSASRPDTTLRSAADSAARAPSTSRPPSGTPPAPLRR